MPHVLQSLEKTGRTRILRKAFAELLARCADGFYKGATAQAIVDTIRELAGMMTLDDLAEFKPEWVNPISTNYRGWTVYEIPPNTQGIAAVMMLSIMEQFPMNDYGFHSVRSLHTMIEAGCHLN